MKQSQKTYEMHKHFLAKKPERERPLGRPRYTWEANLKQMFKKQDAKGGDCARLAQARDQQWTPANSVMNLRVPCRQK
jgi:hypothetical protein